MLGGTGEMLQLIERDECLQQAGGNTGFHGLISKYDELIVFFHFTQ